MLSHEILRDLADAKEFSPRPTGGDRTKMRAAYMQSPSLPKMQTNLRG
jgi:hypothetical protein